MGKEQSRVAWIKGIPARKEAGGFTPEQLQVMLEAGLALLTGKTNPDSGWARYYDIKDIVGIKVNCLGGRSMCTNPSLAVAATRSLGSMGIPPHQVIVWDRSSAELSRCGFHLNRKRNGAYRCVGTNERGVGYENDLTVLGSIGSRYSTLITRHCTAMINMPVLKDHSLCGTTAALKNTFGALHNPNKYHEDRCDPFIADANAVSFVREKNRLVICDALRVQYKGGPSFHPQWVKPLGSILLAEDPVAMDSVCTSILNRIRKKAGLEPVEKNGRIPSYLMTAADAEHKLGRYKIEEIELLERTLTL